MRATLFLVFASLVNIANSSSAIAQSSVTANTKTVAAADLHKEVNDFLAKELSAHLSDIKTLQPPPARVVGTPTTGEFSWGTFMYALARYANTTGQRELAGRDLAKLVTRCGRACLRKSNRSGVSCSIPSASTILRQITSLIYPRTILAWQPALPARTINSGSPPIERSSISCWIVLQFSSPAAPSIPTMRYRLVATIAIPTSTLVIFMKQRKLLAERIFSKNCGRH